MILGEKKKGPKKGPSKKMFQGEKCSVCEDPGRFRNYIFSLSITEYSKWPKINSGVHSMHHRSFAEISQAPEPGMRKNL